MHKPEMFSSFLGFSDLFDESTMDVKAYVGLPPGLTANRAHYLFIPTCSMLFLRKLEQETGIHTYFC